MYYVPVWLRVQAGSEQEAVELATSHMMDADAHVLCAEGAGGVAGFAVTDWEVGDRALATARHLMAPFRRLRDRGREAIREAVNV